MTKNIGILKKVKAHSRLFFFENFALWENSSLRRHSLNKR